MLTGTWRANRNASTVTVASEIDAVGVESIHIVTNIK